MESSRLDGDVLLIWLSDYTEVHTLAHRIDRLAAAGILRFVLSLEAVALVSSTLIGACVKARQDLVARGGDLVLAQASPFTEKTIAVLGLENTLKSWPTIVEAAESLRP